MHGNNDRKSSLVLNWFQTSEDVETTILTTIKDFRKTKQNKPPL